MKNITLAKIICLLFLLIINVTDTNSQIITKFAGTDSTGYAGDGGPATAAVFYTPYVARPDNHGNIYIADCSNCRIRKVNSAGIISTIAGNGVNANSGDGGPATAAEIGSPVTLAMDPAGNIYFAGFDTGSHIWVRKISPSGTITTIAGYGDGSGGGIGDGGPATAAGFAFIYDMVVDSFGNIYVADGQDARIRKINTSGVITTCAGNGTHGYNTGDGGPATNATFSVPSNLAIDGSGNLYISDGNNGCVRKVNATGIITTIAGNGGAGFSGDGGPATAASLYAPNGLAADNSGNVYISDYWNNRIRKVGPDGIITTVIGDGSEGCTGDGGPATDAELVHPDRVAVDVDGNIYITDITVQNVRKVSPSSTGIKAPNLVVDKIDVYPNPATSSLTIMSSAQIVQIAISDLLGQTVFRSNYNSEEVHVDVAGLPAGMYLVGINGTEVRRFVKH